MVSDTFQDLKMIPWLLVTDLWWEWGENRQTDIRHHSAHQQEEDHTQDLHVTVRVLRRLRPLTTDQGEEVGAEERGLDDGLAEGKVSHDHKISPLSPENIDREVPDNLIRSIFPHF